MREITDRITKVMDIIAGVVLVFMMFLTVTDVTLRYLGRPFQGAYEIVALGAAIVIAFAMPRTSIAYQNVAVEVVVNLVAPRVRRWFSVFTRLLGILLFIVLGYGLISRGLELCRGGELTPDLQIVFYPVVLGLAFCAFVECLALFCLMIIEFKTMEFKGGNHGE